MPYTLSDWDVSATPDGSLRVDNAAAAPAIGRWGTVDISWTGATGGSCLGAVSHSDANGIIGLTLVSANTP